MKRVKIILGTILIGVISSGAYDLLRSVPILTTIKNLILWIWNHILKIEIELWQILLVLIMFYYVRKVYLLNKKVVEPEYLKYTTDEFDGLKWKWEYSWNQHTSKYNILSITPICPRCETRMHYTIGHFSANEAKCPRCKYYNLKPAQPHVIEALIIDNIERGNYLKITKES